MTDKMTEEEKITYIRRIKTKNIDWMASFRLTFDIKEGIGLPSGLTGNEAKMALIRAVLEGKRPVIVER